MGMLQRKLRCIHLTRDGEIEAQKIKAVFEDSNALSNNADILVLST